MITTPSQLKMRPETLVWLAEHRLLREAIQAHIVDSISANVALSEEEQQSWFQYFAQQNNLQTQEDIDSFCRFNFLNPESLAHNALLPAKLQKLWLSEFSAKAEAHFLKRKDMLDQVVYSLIRLGDAGVARELYLKILEGDRDFGDLAQQYSDGPERQTRGIVGPVPLNQGHPNLVQRLRSNPEGTLLEPFQVENWWLVVRVEQKAPATFNEDIQIAMARELFEEWLQNEVMRQQQSLVEQASS